MQALRLTTYHHEAELVEIDKPVAGPGEVVIKVGASGACRSDLYMMYGTSDRNPFGGPFVLGHETAGWVHEVGAGVTSVEVGQAVAVYPAWGCGTCQRCRAGIENHCEVIRGRGNGQGHDGGMSEYMLVPAERHLVPLPEGLTPAQAAPMTDAALAPYRAVKRSLAKLDATATAVVIGAGGLGHVAVQLLKLLSAARVIAIDVKQEALELARSCGADALVESGEMAAERVRELTAGRGAEVILDFVGSNETLATAARAVRPLGDITIVGVAGVTLDYRFVGVAYEASVQSSYSGTRAELVEVLDLAARGLIRVETTLYPLAEALTAYGDLSEGRLVGRAVIVPGSAS